MASLREQFFMGQGMGVSPLIEGLLGNPNNQPDPNAPIGHRNSDLDGSGSEYPAPKQKTVPVDPTDGAGFGEMQEDEQASQVPTFEDGSIIKSGSVQVVKFTASEPDVAYEPAQNGGRDDPSFGASYSAATSMKVIATFEVAFEVPMGKSEELLKLHAALDPRVSKDLNETIIDEIQSQDANIHIQNVIDIKYSITPLGGNKVQIDLNVVSEDTKQPEYDPDLDYDDDQPRSEWLPNYGAMPESKSMRERFFMGTGMGINSLNEDDEATTKIKNHIAHLKDLISSAPAEDRAKLREILHWEQDKLKKSSSKK